MSEESKSTSSDKVLAKAEKALDRDTKDEMQAMTVEGLERVLVDAQVGMAQAKTELEANTQFQAAKSILSDLNGGLRDLNKRQQAKITYALHLLESKGKI